MSECYLMCLERPVCATRPARHYLGFTSDTVKREADYRQLKFSYHGRLMLAAVERGIGFTVARIWKNCTKRDEKLLRDLHNGPSLCPLCNPALELTTRLNSAGRYQTYATRDPRRVRYGDLRLLRHRATRPARRRQRLDGSLNYVDTASDPVPAYIETDHGLLDIRGSYQLIPPDVNYAEFGYDIDLPY